MKRFLLSFALCLSALMASAVTYSHSVLGRTFTFSSYSQYDANGRFIGKKAKTITINISVQGVISMYEGNERFSADRISSHRDGLYDRDTGWSVISATTSEFIYNFFFTRDGKIKKITMRDNDVSFVFQK